MIPTFTPPYPRSIIFLSHDRGKRDAQGPTLDGLRTQIHKDGQQVSIFSRNLENMSQMFPEIIEGTRKQVQADSVILDAEALAYNPASEEFRPFQETARRRRKYDIEAMAQQMPLKAFVFDILYKNGASLLDTPLVERMKILEETIQPDDILMLTGNHIVRDAKTLSLLFEEAISKGLEGVVVKKLESPYEAGARNFNQLLHPKRTTIQRRTGCHPDCPETPSPVPPPPR